MLGGGGGHLHPARWRRYTRPQDRWLMRVKGRRAIHVVPDACHAGAASLLGGRDRGSDRRGVPATLAGRESCLVVYEVWAKDGSHLNEVRTPVTLL